ncbi:MAG: helix-turn-helix domain-containing protein, partial [Planctomycetaceae bacterium]|nr:helix-turn-helix domain-containing protein [Planctomycetaceae bacterium]
REFPNVSSEDYGARATIFSEKVPCPSFLGEHHMITIPASQPSRVRIAAKPAPQKPKKERTEDTSPIGVSIPTAARMVGLSYNTFIPLVREGKIRTVKVGKRVIVSVQSLRDFVDGKKEPCDSKGDEPQGHTEF